MKTSIIVLIIAFTFITLSCKKVDYSSLSSTCELCQFANETEGTYRGVMSWDSVVTMFPDVTLLSDSVTVEVEHIFLNNNPYDDSTIMYFRTTWIRDQVGVVDVDTIQIHSQKGNVNFYSNYQVDNHSDITRYSWIKDGVYRKFSRFNYTFSILHIDATLNKI